MNWAAPDDSLLGMSSSELDYASLERIVPGQLDDRDVTGRATLDLHMARYRFAASHLVPGTAA